MSDKLRRMAFERNTILENIKRLKDNLREIDNEIIEELGEKPKEIFGSDKNKKDYGEQTFMEGDCKVTLKKSRRVKYDNNQMITAGQQLSWDELNRFFKVKFDMGETGHKELQAAALDSDKYSDVLSLVDEAREVILGEVTIGNIEIIED